MGITYQPDVIIAKTEQDIAVKSVGVLVRVPAQSLRIFRREWH